MTSEQNRHGVQAERPRPTRAQRIVAAGFLGAFGLTIITVLLTGLWVRAPHLRAGSKPPPAAAGAERNAPVDAATPAGQAPEARSQPDTAGERESGGPRKNSKASESNETAPADGR